MMVQTLLTLPYDIRVQIWHLVVGPSKVVPCKCVNVAYYCTITHPGSCFGDFDVHRHCDNRILRVCKVIYHEIRPMIARSPKIFHVCSGICLNSLFISIPLRERSFIQSINAKVYIGQVSEESLQGLSGQELLQTAESWCGPFVSNALKSRGVADIVDARLVSEIEKDDKGRRTVWVALTLASDGRPER